MNQTRSSLSIRTRRSPDIGPGFDRWIAVVETVGAPPQLVHEVVIDAPDGPPHLDRGKSVLSLHDDPNAQPHDHQRRGADALVHLNHPLTHRNHPKILELVRSDL